jgi:hypothetical protein
MTVILVNRAESSTQSVDLSIANFEVDNGNYTTLTLSGISGETFVSHENNALKSGTVSVQSKKASLTLPAKSITAVLLKSSKPKTIALPPQVAVNTNLLFRENGSWFVDNTAGNVKRVEIFNSLGQRVYSLQNLAKGAIRLQTEGLTAGRYLVRVLGTSGISVQKVIGLR